jgi:ribonuclease E
MLINVSAGDECRVAILHEGRLEELFIERSSTQSHVGNIYKARVTNVEPSIQAAFIDFGLPQNGFLHISDVQPQYFPDYKGEIEEVGRKIPRHNRPPIQRCFRRGQELIVQVTKEGVGTKGPTLTTYLSIPGRFLVMMPGMHRHGVSRKIEDDADRRAMRELLDQLDLPSDMGFIMRTAGLGRTKRELQRDLQYLTRLWKAVTERIKRLNAPAGLYRESDLVIRTIRDVYTADFRRLVVDDAKTAKTAREFLQIAMPRSKATVELYTDREPLFHRYGIEDEIEKINMRHVPLPSGGSLVIESTEALVAIDVNSGRFRTTDDAEATAFKINIEAAEEIARQLRLRDLGGLIVCDFIDMRLDRHRRTVERALREALKVHKERARIIKMSAFGLIEMTRQRRGPSLKRNIYADCPHCQGTGQVKMPDSVILDVMRIIQLAAHRDTVQRVMVTVANDVAYRILNSKRNVINQIETETGKEIRIRGNAQFVSDQVECICEDARGRAVSVVPGNNAASGPGGLPGRK